MKKSFNALGIVLALLITALVTGCGTDSVSDKEPTKKKIEKEEKQEKQSITEVESAFPKFEETKETIQEQEPEPEPEPALDIEDTEDTEDTEDIYIKLFPKYRTEAGGAYAPFYGIWVYANPDSAAADDFYYSTDDWENTFVLLSSDWENLNAKPYYVISIGKYETEEDAKAALPDIKAKYPDAYVKYSGNYKLPQDSDKRYELYVYACGNITDEGDKVQIKALMEDGTINTYIIDSDTAFDETCDTGFFEDYENGESVLEWYKKVMKKPADEFLMGPPIMGVFDISITGNHIDKYYGSYWWD